MHSTIFISLGNQDYGRRESAALSAQTPLSAKVVTNLDDKERSLGWYSLLAN
jgi:hypothetical protein